MYRTYSLVTVAAILSILAGCSGEQTADTDGQEVAGPELTAPSIDPSSPGIVAAHEPEENEVHFSTIYQLTDGGENAEAYFNRAGDKIIFQSTRDDFLCDQVFIMNIDGTDLRLVSTGQGRTTCSFIGGDDDFIIYSSTHHLGADCPPLPEAGAGGYAWMLYKYDVFRANFDGSDPVNLTNSDSYDAEAIVRPDAREIVFSSTRTGDQEIFLMNADGSNVRQVTDTLGYDGGPFYSWDGTKIVFRSYRPKTEEEIDSYKNAMAQGMMLRVPLEIYMMDADGGNIQQITDLGSSSFAPFMHPDGERIIFCSNYGGRPWVFNLWMINVDGTDLQQITYNDSFDGFPMFSRDGRYLVFCSNRHQAAEGETNVFITEWQD